MADAQGLVDALTQEFATRGDFDRSVNLPAIPTPDASISSLVASVKAIKTILDVRRGSGSVLDRWIAMRDLTDAGSLQIKIGSATVGSTAGSNISFPTSSADPRPYLATPPPVGGLAVHGTVNNVVLDWTLIDYQNHSYVEVWRGSTIAISSAVEIGQSTALVYVDSTAAMGVTYYYWVRAVGFDTAGNTITGPFQATDGTAGGRQPVSNSVMANLSVDTAQIVDLAVQDAKVGSVNVSKLTAGTLQVGASIASTSYAAGASGWRILASGGAEFNNVTVRGAVYASSGTFTGTINAGSGTIGGAIIGVAGVQSSGYVAGTSGWLLDNTNGKIWGASATFKNAAGTRILDLDASGTSPVLQVGSALVIDAAGNAYFGGKLAAGSATRAATHGGTVAWSSSTAMSLNNAEVSCVTYTPSGDKNVTVTVNANVCVQTSSPTSIRIRCQPLVNGSPVAYYVGYPDWVEVPLPAAPVVPEFMGPTTASYNAPLARGTGATPYGNCVVANFSMPVEMGSMSADPWTFSCRAEISFWDGSGNAASIGGHSIFMTASGTVREYLA